MPRFPLPLNTENKHNLTSRQAISSGQKPSCRIPVPSSQSEPSCMFAAC